MNERIEKLALEKSYAQLTDAERAEVLAEMSPEAYRQLHALLRAAPALDPGPGPAAALRARLLTHFAAAAVPARRWPHHIPWWQAAAAVALSAAATLFFHKPVVQEISTEVVQRQVDTVYIEKPQWRERVVWRTKVVYRERPVALAPLADSVPVIFTPGASLEKEPALMQFFVQVR